MNSHAKPPRREEESLVLQRYALYRLFVFFVAQLPCSIGRAEEATWLQRLPTRIQNGILWSTSYEAGDLRQWVRPQAEYPGSGLFNSGGSNATACAQNRVVHSGRWALETTIQNAYRGRYGAQAVRLMIWTDRAWDHGGSYFPNRAYYSTWLYVPHAYNPAETPSWDMSDSGWWNVMQFKSEEATGESQPIWVLNLARTPDNKMLPYLYSPANQSSYEPSPPISFPIADWMHIEVFYVSAVGERGQLAVYLNGERIIKVDSVVTSLGGKTGQDVHPIWGIGNYTDHIIGDPAGPGRATVYFDDTAVSTLPLSKWVSKH